jgi:TonB family protein
MSKPLLILLLTTLIASDQQKLPSRVAAGETTEVCGTVLRLTDGPAHCDASLDVDAGGQTQTVVVPASVRRTAAGLVRHLPGSEMCVTGVIELAPGIVRIRVADAAAIRVVKPGPSAAMTVPDAVDMCESDVTAPRLLADVKPQYTEQAMRARITGVVELEAIVLATGEVGTVRVTKSLEKSLDEQAMKALRQWKFAPGTRLGKPVPVLVSVEMTFALGKRQ